MPLHLSWTMLIIALVRCFRSDGRHRDSILIALIVPVARLLIDANFREALRERFARYCAEFQDYAQQGGRIPYEAIWVLVVLPVAILNLSSNAVGGNGDTWPIMAASSSIVREGNTEISEYFSSYIEKDAGVPYCVVPGRAGYYSGYPAGMNVFAIPVCAISRLLGADLSSRKGRLRLEKWTAAWVAAISMGLFFLIAIRLADPHSAAIATVFLASGSAMLSTVGHGLWQHGGVIFWALVVLALETGDREAPSAGRTLLQGSALGMMVSCRLSACLIAAALGTWIVLRDRQRAFMLMTGMALGYLPWAVYYASVYDALLGPSQLQLASGNWGGLENIIPVLFSPGAGLLMYQPWIALVLLLPILEWKRPTGWIWLCVSIVVLQLALVVHWKCWWGGSCWGSRLCCEAIPFAAFMTLTPIAYLRKRWWGKLLLLLIGLASAFVHIYVNYFEEGFYRPPEDLMNWSRAAFLPTIR